jgi:hypothetical protein
LLRQVYLDALRTREQKISRIRDSNYDLISKKAAANWVDYQPTPSLCRPAGVDSSWNKRAYQGLNLFVIDAVAISSTNELLASAYVNDIADSARREELETKAMSMEALVTQQARESGKADVVCVDGSVVARLNIRKTVAAFDEMKKYADSIFVAKSSESRSQFGGLDSRAGDIYYYNRISNSRSGYSLPRTVGTPYGTLSEVYARLRNNTPMLRVEILGQAAEQEVREVLNKLCYHSISGYPYCLKLAHNSCKISDQDIDRIASIYSLRNEHGAREALNE